MKKMMMVMSVMVMSLVGAQTMQAQGVYEPTSKVPFTISFRQLSRYLDLHPSQQETVFRISEAFMAEQQEAMGRGSLRKEAIMQRALHANLKQMKETLNEAQYCSYVALLNVTNNNNQLLNNNLMDSYLAKNR